jgi:undecaprenyl-diphosphatase
MEFITTSRNWVIPIALIWAILFFLGGKKGRVLAILLLPMFFLSDFCTVKFLKPLFGRPRPLGHGGLAMPSAHAANAFAAATLFTLLLAERMWQRVALYMVAALIALSRVYIGVHYPTDVFAGALIGSLDSILVYTVYFHNRSRLERWSPWLFNARAPGELKDTERKNPPTRTYPA